MGAAFVDAVVLFPFMYAADPDRYAPGNGQVAVLLYVVSCGLSIGYTVFFHARYGQTFGKMAFRIRVMELSETRNPTLRQAFLRDIGEVIWDLLVIGQLVVVVASGHYPGDEDSGSPGDYALMWGGLAWLLLEFVTMLTNTKRRAVHDYIAATVVVRERPSTQPDGAP